MKYSIGLSPCPNDTFILGALLNGKTTAANTYVPHMADVEDLNHSAMQQTLDITKMSFHAYAHCAHHYNILPVGAALGFGNGPLVISRTKIYPDEISHVRLAAPGKYTTAAMLAGIFFGPDLRIQHYLFSDIEEAILSGECDAGIIIHESRFTYQAKGLKKICDTGEMWEQETSLPLPLGCFAVKKNLTLNESEQIISDIAASVSFAKLHPEKLYSYILKHAQINDQKIVQQHIATYVNDFSYSLNDIARKAITELFLRASEKKIIPSVKPAFL
jgi:1,4-dihydroxy-6-naphthoate synthase